MNRLQLYRTLYRHRSLSMRRALDYEHNRSAKYLFYIGYIMGFAYMLFIAVLLSLKVNNMRDTNAAGLIVGILPIILLVDLFIRFTYQQTPAQIIKCYALLPLPRKVCIESFIGASLFNLGNAWWYVLFVPYCVMSVVFSYGLLATILLLAFIGLAILLNSQLYVLFRTLISQSLLWVFGLLAAYGLLAIPMIFGGNGSFASSLFIYSRLGIALSQGEMWPLLIVLALLIAVVWLNREVQFRAIWRELTSEKAATKVDGKDRLAFLRQHGAIGEYAHLEWKLISRNKFPRKTFIYSFFSDSTFKCCHRFHASLQWRWNGAFLVFLQLRHTSSLCLVATVKHGRKLYRHAYGTSQQHLFAFASQVLCVLWLAYSALYAYAANGVRR